MFQETIVQINNGAAVAELSDALEKVVQGTAVTDPDTDQKWTPANLTGWIANSSLASNLDKLWDMKLSELLEARYKKFRKMGVFTRAEPKKRGRERKAPVPTSPAPSAT